MRSYSNVLWFFIKLHLLILLSNIHTYIFLRFFLYIIYVYLTQRAYLLIWRQGQSHRVIGGQLSICLSRCLLLNSQDLRYRTDWHEYK